MKKYTPVFFVFSLLITLLSFNAKPVSAANCASGDLFSTITGAACNTTIGCGVGDLFSSVTGQSCNDNSSAVSQFNTLNKSNFVIGSQGEDVKALQRFLKNEGYYFGNIDGKYGIITARAVKDFQVDNNLTETQSIVSQFNTLNKSNFVIGSQGEDVKALQRFLKNEGYYFGNIDGKYGIITARAVKDFQVDNNLIEVTPSCVSEGGNLGALVLGNNLQCCSGLVAYVPDGIVGTKGTCVKPYTSNEAPVISGVSGPTTLNVGQSGTWSVSASDPEQGTLSYAVSWGDTVSVASGAESASFVSTATFSHIYNNVGVYIAKFTVKDSQGLSVGATINVNVVTPTIPVPVLSTYTKGGLYGTAVIKQNDAGVSSYCAGAMPSDGTNYNGVLNTPISCGADKIPVCATGFRRVMTGSFPILNSAGEYEKYFTCESMEGTTVTSYIKGGLYGTAVIKQNDAGVSSYCAGAMPSDGTNYNGVLNTPISCGADKIPVCATGFRRVIVGMFPTKNSVGEYEKTVTCESMEGINTNYTKGGIYGLAIIQQNNTTGVSSYCAGAMPSDGTNYNGSLNSSIFCGADKIPVCATGFRRSLTGVFSSTTSSMQKNLTCEYMGSGTPPPITYKYKCSGTSCVQDNTNGTFTSSNCNNSCGVVVPPPSSCADTCENHGYQCGTHSFCGVTQNCGGCFESGYSCQNNICVAGQTYFNTGIFNWGKVTDDKGKTNCESRSSFVCRSQSKYNVGEVVKFTAQILDPLYSFNKWSSCACSDSSLCNLDVYGCNTANPCTLSIPAPSGGLEPGIQACFKAPEGYKKLTVSGISKGGYITSSPGKIELGIKQGSYLFAGTYHFTQGTSVTLTAHPEPGYKFYMWSGWKKNGVLAPGFSSNCSDDSGTCTLMLDSDRSVSFMFNAI